MVTDRKEDSRKTPGKQGPEGSVGRRQISDDGRTFPAWSRNGHDLFFWQFDEHIPQSQLMVASYQARGDSFVADDPRTWSERRLVSFTTRSYDPAPDGKRVVALMPADPPQERPDHVVFLLNFFDDLHRRVPLSSK